MVEEFNLSEKIWHFDNPNIEVKDVKEFIRLLKERSNEAYCSGSYCQAGSIINKIIDKLSGDLK